MKSAFVVSIPRTPLARTSNSADSGVHEDKTEW
jgi:hypothetical protein